MKKLFVFLLVLGLFVVGSGLAQANIYTWNFTNAADYYVGGDLGTAYAPVITEGVGAYVPPRPWIDSWDDPPYGSDWASVFARINTQANLLKIDDIIGGGFNLTGMNHPDAVYGSLYLSPTGGNGSNVLILLSPMSYTGTTGNLNYTFDLNTHADVRAWNGTGWSVYNDATSGTFANAISWINSNGFGDNYAAFVGPQIGLSNTSETTFTVTEITLNTNVPEPATMLLLGLGLMGLAGVRRKFKK